MNKLRHVFCLMLGFLRDIKFINELLCKHEWTSHGWSYLRCKRCVKTKYSPRRNKNLNPK